MDKFIKFQEERSKLDCYLKRSEIDRDERKKKLEKIIDIFKDEEIKQTLQFDHFRFLKVGERVEINDEVSFEKTFEDKNRMVFLTYMMEGGSFGFHEHDCIEVTKILKGNLIEKTRGYRVYREDETIIYAPYEQHRPYATQDSTYEVTFLKELL